MFVEEFDPEFWESVVGWSRAHTKYRERMAAETDDGVQGGGAGVLPPAVPEEPGWECEYCAYRKRCGKDDSGPVQDMGVSGFLPLTEYSRSAVAAHMEAYPSVPVSPTVAHEHPSLLADGHPVASWLCRECGEIPLDRVGWSGDVSAPPLCPECEECSLRGALPEQLESVSIEGDESV